MVFSIIIGYLIGVPAAYFLTGALLRFMASKMASGEEKRRWIRNVGGVMGAIALAPAIFAGVIFAGYMGQGPEAAVPNVMGSTDLGIPTMVGLLLAVGTILIVAIASALGALIGLLITRAVFAEPKP